MTALRRLAASLILMSLCFPLVASGDEAGSLRGRWTLTRLVDSDGEHPLGTAPVTLSLAADGAVTGSTGVNDYRAEYTAAANGGLRWHSPLTATRRGGAEGPMRLERAYLPALSNAARWEVLPGDRSLLLSAADGRTVLTFRRQTDTLSPNP